MGAPGKNFFKQRAAIATQAVVLKQQREGAATAGTAALDQIYASLRTTGNGASSILSADNDRRTAALQRIGSRSAGATARTVSQAQAGNVNRYGSAMGQLSSQQLKPAAAQAREAAGVGKATAKAGKSLATAGNQAMDILQAGNVGARASADYAMASALMYRAKDDASLIAQQRTDLAMQRSQAQLDWDLWKRQQDYLKKADDASGSKGQMVALADGMGSAISGLHDLFSEEQDAGLGEGTTPGAIATRYIEEQGITDKAEADLIFAAARAMFPYTIAGGGDGINNGEARTAAIDAVTRYLGRYPQYDKYRKQIEAAVYAAVTANSSARSANTGPGGDDEPVTTTETVGMPGAAGRAGETREVTTTTPSDEEQAAQRAIGHSYESPSDAPPGTVGKWETRQFPHGATRRVWVVTGVV